VLKVGLLCTPIARSQEKGIVIEQSARITDAILFSTDERNSWSRVYSDVPCPTGKSILNGDTPPGRT